jgi:hypothetical protein
MARLVLGQVVQETDGVLFQVLQRLGFLVDTDDETFRLHGDRRDVTADVQITLTVGRRRETVDRTVDTIPRFDADAWHKGLVIGY